MQSYLHNATEQELFKSDNGKVLNGPFYTKMRVSTTMRVK